MSVPRYGVLKGGVNAAHFEVGETASPHYHIGINTILQQGRAPSAPNFRIAVNVRARTGVTPADHHLRLAIRRIRGRWAKHFDTLPFGFTTLVGTDGLDYARQRWTTPRRMIAVPPTLPGPDNDLNEALDRIIRQALRDHAPVCAFGSLYGPQDRPDPIFGFAPAQGLHNVHRNQGSPHPGPFADDNGVYRDGALFVRDNQTETWLGFFLAFANQAWHTDDTTGHPLL